MTQELEEYAYRFFDRSRNKWTVHFHISKDDFAETPCKCILKSVFWDRKDYLDPKRTGRGELSFYAHFVPILNGTSRASGLRRPVQGSPIVNSPQLLLDLFNSNQHETTRATSVAESIDPLDPEFSPEQENIPASPTVNEVALTMDSVESDRSEAQRTTRQSGRRGTRGPLFTHRFTPEDDKYFIEAKTIHKHSYKQIRDGNPSRPDWRGWSVYIFRNYWLRHLSQRPLPSGYQSSEE